MNSLHQHLDEYHKQLKKGSIQQAYRGLMDYMMGLRTHFQKKYPDHSTPGSVYFGYMDMTYFPIFPESLKDRGLKIAVVFLHEEFRFEVWLSGKNQQVMKHYWKIFEESNWRKYKIVPTGKWADSILEHVLVAKPDFRDLDVLTNQIEKGTLKFIQDVESFLLKCQENGDAE